MAPQQERPDLTVVGTRNFAKLVELAARMPGDAPATKQMADCFAALLSEVAPVHREVLSSAMTHSSSAPGRSRPWLFPPGLTGGVHARQKWVALVLMDCVEAVSDTLAADHSLVERQGWTRRLRLYTRGADGYPVTVE
ncbi:MAG: hypothetical protein ACOH1Y_14960 [Propionicimonas sp.]